MRPSTGSERQRPPDAPTLDVRLPDGRVLRFSRPFHIGRDPDCEVQVQDAHVSRRHALVSLARGEWTIRDLQSSNGLIVDGQRVESVQVGDGVRIRLGEDGPLLQIGSEVDLAEAPDTGDAESTEDSVILDRYFHATGDEEVGGRTMMIRRAFHKYRRKQRRQYLWMVAAAMVIGIAALVYLYRVQQEVELLRQ